MKFLNLDSFTAQFYLNHAIEIVNQPTLMGSTQVVSCKMYVIYCVEILHLERHHFLCFLGTVKLENSLDYERSKEYILTIEAEDKGTPPLSNTAILKINISDHNDNSPVFSQEQYHISVREDSQVGTRLLRVRGQATLIITDTLFFFFFFQN